MCRKNIRYVFCSLICMISVTRTMSCSSVLYDRMPAPACHPAHCCSVRVTLSYNAARHALLSCSASRYSIMQCVTLFYHALHCCSVRVKLSYHAVRHVILSCSASRYSIMHCTAAMCASRASIFQVIQFEGVFRVLLSRPTFTPLTLFEGKLPKKPPEIKFVASFGRRNA